MKKLLIFTLLMTFAVSTASAAPVYTYRETSPVASGMSLTNVREFHTDGNISYSVIKADLTDEETELRLYKSPLGPDVADTVSNLSKTRENTVAAINADFFSAYKNGKSFSLGIEVDDGRLIQSPINPDTMATIFYDDGKAEMSYLDFNISVVAPNGEKSLVRHLNKHTDYYGDIVMYTHEFNDGMSPAPGNEICEVVVEDGKVTEFRRQLPSVEIPENGCVLVVSEGVSMFLANNFEVGDEIEFTYTVSPDILEVKTAFGGGAMLVKDGVIPTEYSHVVSGKQPRSAIGIDKDGTTLYLVAVDGRQEKSRGMTMNELSSLMLSLGCYNAVNLDGGGSTNMVASTPDKPSLHTVNSPSENRKVINAVGLTYSGKSDKAGGIMLKADKDIFFAGTPVQITASAYDENSRPFDGEISLATDSGTINNGILTTDKEGKVKIKASIGDISRTIELYCVKSVAGIDTPSYLSLKKGETKKADINIYDQNGNYVSVSDASAFEVTSSNPDVLETDGFGLKGKAAGTAIVTIKKDGVKSHISVCVNEETEDKTEDTVKLRFNAPPSNVYPESTMKSKPLFAVTPEFEGNTLLASLANKKAKEEAQDSAPAVASLGNISFFKNYETENSLFIELDTSKGGIRKSSSKQWESMTNAISASDKKNIFILAKNSVFGEDEFENKVIRDYLSSIGKKVSVITGGEANSFSQDRGVNYFSLGNRSGVKADTAYLSNYKYLIFSDSGEFEWKNCYTNK